MFASFIDEVDTLEPYGADVMVTFTGRPGCYRVNPAPEDLLATLRSALYSGCQVQITYDPQSLEVVDVIPS